MTLNHNSNFSTELRLLLLCLNDRIYESKSVEIIELCSNDIKWEEFKYLVIRHKCLPLIYKLFKDKYADCIPSALIQEMKTAFVTNSARNLYFTAILHKIIEFFNQANIISVPLKGPAISEQLYGDINFRIFSDLDILVPANKAFKAFNILISKGLTPELNLNEKQFNAYMQSEDHIILSTNAQKVNIELHWELSARYLSKPFTFEQIKDQLKIDNFYGKEISTFSKEDHLVYICLHGSKHLWETFELVFQVACLLKSDLDWERVLLLAQSTHCHKKLLLGLCLCRFFFNCHLPDHIQSQISHDKAIKQLSTYLINILVSPLEENIWDISKSKFTKYQFKTLDRYQDKIRYLFFMVMFPTNNDWASVNLSDRFSFLYYIIRPFRLLFNMLNRIKK